MKKKADKPDKKAASSKSKDFAELNAGEQVALVKAGLGYNTFRRPIKYWLQTHSRRLNTVLGSPELGVPYGKLIVLCGDYSSGKTLLATKLLGLAQAEGAQCGYIDIENSADPEFTRKISGLDFGKELESGVYSRVALFRPEVGVFGKRKAAEEVRLQTAEELFKVVEGWMLRSHAANPEGKIAVLLDSSTAIVPEEELTAGIDEQNMRSRMSLAVFLNTLLKRWMQLASNINAAIIIVSQIRIDPMAMFGNPERIPGGKGLVFYPAVVAQLRRANKGGNIQDDKKNVIGLRSTIRNLKNKAGGGSIEGKRCGMLVWFEKNQWKFRDVEDVKL